MLGSSSLSMDDLISYGFLPEFVGRFPVEAPPLLRRPCCAAPAAPPLLPRPCCPCCSGGCAAAHARPPATHQVHAKLSALTEEEMIHVMTTPRNALLKQVRLRVRVRVRVRLRVRVRVRV